MAGIPEGSDSHVYTDDWFKATIQPDGKVRFHAKRARWVGKHIKGTTEIIVAEFDITDLFTPDSHLRLYQKMKFMQATADIREKQYLMMKAHHMKTALENLPRELHNIYNNNAWSPEEKRAIFEQRLDECNLSIKGGRKAAKIISDYIQKAYRK
jgi:hypothetical protein